MIRGLRHADQRNPLRRRVFMDRSTQNQQRGNPHDIRATAFQVLKSSAHRRSRIDHVIDDRNAPPSHLLAKCGRNPVPRRKQALVRRPRKALAVSEVDIEVERHKQPNERSFNQRRANRIRIPT